MNGALRPQERLKRVDGVKEIPVKDPRPLHRLVEVESRQIVRVSVGNFVDKF
jgi:hypothetical protein